MWALNKWYWLNYWHIVICKGISGFMLNTLLKKNQSTLSFLSYYQQGRYPQHWDMVIKNCTQTMVKIYTDTHVHYLIICIRTNYLFLFYKSCAT